VKKRRFVAEPASEVKTESVLFEGFEDIFEVSGTERTEQGTSGTIRRDDPGHSGQSPIDATEVWRFISTAEAAKLAQVDSRTIRRWYEQKKLRGQFSKGKLLIAQEDLVALAALTVESFTAGGETESGTFEEPSGTSGTFKTDDPRQPGPTMDIPKTPAVVFSDVFDRIERLSRENGELRAQFEQKCRENQELKLLIDTRHKPGWWSRFCSWFKS
jgi:hypothetical protein